MTITLQDDCGERVTVETTTEDQSSGWSADGQLWKPTDRH
jgi:hypothetical protein